MGKSPTHPPFICNAQGQRVTRVEDEVVTHFYYTGSALLFTTVNEYVLQTQNILDPSGTIVASKRFEGQAETEQDPYADDYFFYRYDIRGSVTNIVDGAGAVVKSYDYDEFGVTTASGDAFFNEVTFTVSISDASGLLYMNGRYYNPATARFLSQDTYTGSASVPWTQHLYAYCNNNPVNMVDPTGHVPVYMTLLNDGNDGTVMPEPTLTPTPTPAPPTPTPTPGPQPGPSPEITQDTHNGTADNGILNFIKGVFRSLEFEMSAGFGIGASAELADIGLSALLRSDFLVIKADSEGFDIGRRESYEIGGSYLFGSTTYYGSDYQSYITWELFMNQTGVSNRIPIFDIGGYLMVGVGVSLHLNPYKFWGIDEEKYR